MFTLKYIVMPSIITQKMKFSFKDFFCKSDRIRSFLRIWSRLMKKSSMENFIFCAVYDDSDLRITWNKPSEPRWRLNMKQLTLFNKNLSRFEDKKTFDSDRKKISSWL